MGCPARETTVSMNAQKMSSLNNLENISLGGYRQRILSGERKSQRLLLTKQLILRLSEAAVDRTIDTKACRGWLEVNNLWTYDDETDDAGMSYVNLQLNPEKYTGYTGSFAGKIWEGYLHRNCPKYASGESCPERRILRKLTSGLHSSISIHIASEYPLDEERNTATDYLEQTE